jgi:FAD/FMN-containing dehydrogenase
MAGRIDKRELLKRGAAIAFVPAGLVGLSSRATATPWTGHGRRARPEDPNWPSPKDWDRLAAEVGGRLQMVRSPLVECREGRAKCGDVFALLRNPFFIGEQAGLTQTLGWAGAWKSEPSVYAVRAESTSDVAAAVNFARDANIRLVVKGGGHSYQGTSNAPDSLLVWTKAMNSVVLHDAFVPNGCAGLVHPQPAASIGAGAVWHEVYEAVTTKGGRYVQGGGCTTVGVAGLIQGGGFGSFSKRFGLAAASLLEAEIVTADGRTLIANPCSHPDLFWALKGGGGGSWGVVTRLTLKTHTLPKTLGGISATVKAASDAAYRRLIDKALEFYATSLFNPSWGEQMLVIPGNELWIRMTFEGLDEDEVREVWRPLFDWIKSQPQDYHMGDPSIHALPARRFWDPTALKVRPGVVVSDARPGAPEGNFVWAGDAAEVGHYLHAFQSRWLPQTLLSPEQRPRLVAALYEASRTWWITLQFNKGLAGAPAEAIAAARKSAINPVALDAFALALSSASEPPSYPGILGHEPDYALGAAHAHSVQLAMDQVRKVAPKAGSYLAESDYFDPGWREAYWGIHHDRLKNIKKTYDPSRLFTVHHGVSGDD